MVMRLSACNLCERVAAKPNASTEWLIQDSHEAVGIAQCGCGKLWLHFWVEIFDDITHYWAPLTSEGAGSLRKQAGSEDEVVSMARTLIERERTVLMDGTARTEWIVG